MATILVVDDVAANRDFLVNLLGYASHRMVEASDGQAGLDAVRAERPDLVITDVLMPVMDGYDFVRHLRRDPETASIPVIFSTAHYGEREARELARTIGVSHVLPKPVEPEEVLRVVSVALSGAADAATTPGATQPGDTFDREHLRLITDKLSETAGDLRNANARLRALINIGLELASERHPDRLLRRVCLAARDLFGATYVTLGVMDRSTHLVKQFITCGIKVPGTAPDADWVKPGDAAPGILARVTAERLTVRGTNAGGDPAGLQFPAGHARVEAFAAAPISSPAHVYGWICLVGNEGRTFTHEDEQLVLALAGQVGRIYENGYFAKVAEHRAEELKRERDRAQRYLDTAESILLALDRDGRITMVNRYALTLLGRTADELIGQDWVETCMPARVRGATKRKFQALLDGDLSVREGLIVSRSGEERLIEWRNTVLHDADGRVSGTLSCGIDITERNRAAEALRSAEERMRFVLESANIGIWDMDYTTGVLRWSETLEAHYGIKPGSFPGTFDAFIELVHPDDRASLQESLATATATGADFQVNSRALWPDGQVRWLSGAGRTLLGDDGTPVRAVGISIDVTEQRLLQDQYLQAQKMEAVGRLAGGVAHDFNNLLTVILGYCELSLADLAPHDPRHTDISEIRKAGERAAALTRQLLAFSRKQIIEPTLIDLNVVMTDVRPMLERIIGEDVAVRLVLQTGLARVKADRGQVEQVILNLVVNARDAMPEGGALTISTENTNLDEPDAATHGVAPGRYVAVTVMDTGMGMSADVQARLFEPFFTTKEIGKGTGLGLATVHGIVMRSRGGVKVYSEPGVGTSFTVYFPQAEATDVIPDAPAAAVRRPLGTQTVLVVEDSPGLRALTRRLLQRQGFNVLVAEDAADAFRQFEEHQHSIDVLLTDVVMPGASGPELSKQLVALRPGLKVIYMSGYTDEAITQHGILNPGIAFVQKPFTSETLGRKISEVLGR